MDSSFSFKIKTSEMIDYNFCTPSTLQASFFVVLRALTNEPQIH